MDKDALRVSTKTEVDGRTSVAVIGYLDEKGGRELARKILEDLPENDTRVEINLEAVALFSCSGARRLLAALVDVAHGGPDLCILVGAQVLVEEIDQPALALQLGKDLDGGHRGGTALFSPGAGLLFFLQVFLFADVLVPG